MKYYPISIITNLLYAKRYSQIYSTRYHLSQGSPKNSILKYLTVQYSDYRTVRYNL